MVAHHLDQELLLQPVLRHGLQIVSHYRDLLVPDFLTFLGSHLEADMFDQVLVVNDGLCMLLVLFFDYASAEPVGLCDDV